MQRDEAKEMMLNYYLFKHTMLSLYRKHDTYVRMLFIDFSLAFNTIMPLKLITELVTSASTPPSVTGYWTSHQKTPDPGPLKFFVKNNL